MNTKDFLLSFKPQRIATPLTEKLVSAAAACVAMLALDMLLRYMLQAVHPLPLLFSIGASATLLFILPHSPMSHPWALLGGNLVSALVSWTCVSLIPDPLLAAGCGVGLAILLMQLLHCLHPPAAATALALTLSAPQFHDMSWPGIIGIVTLNSILLLALALLINNLLPGRRYPMRQAHKYVAQSASSLEHADVEWALQQMGDGMVDVSEEDILEIYRLASDHAATRRSQPRRPT